MIGIIVSGHGNFPDGLLSAVKLLSGEPKDVAAVNFTEEKSTDVLKNEISDAINTLGEEILILTDIKGGSPYNQSVVLKEEIKSKKIEVLSGANLPMLVLGVMEREIKGLDELVKDLLINGQSGIDRFELKNTVKTDFEEDGI